MPAIIRLETEQKNTALAAALLDAEQIPRLRDVAVRREDEGALSVVVFCAIPAYQGGCTNGDSTGEPCSVYPACECEGALAMRLEGRDNFVSRAASEILAGQTMFSFSLTEEMTPVVAALIEGKDETVEIVAPSDGGPNRNDDGEIAV